jgi:nicotinamide riboside transporter PnuC
MQPVDKRRVEAQLADFWLLIAALEVILTASALFIGHSTSGAITGVIAGLFSLHRSRWWANQAKKADGPG